MGLDYQPSGKMKGSEETRVSVRVNRAEAKQYTIRVTSTNDRSGKLVTG